jgi:hypothetical protein
LLFNFIIYILYNIIKQHCCIQYCTNAKIKVAGTGMDGQKFQKQVKKECLGMGMDGQKWVEKSK